MVGNAKEGPPTSNRRHWRWDELDQQVIDTAVKQWRTRLHACIKSKGGYFLLTLINMHMLRLCALEALLLMFVANVILFQVPYVL